MPGIPPQVYLPDSDDNYYSYSAIGGAVTDVIEGPSTVSVGGLSRTKWPSKEPYQSRSYRRLAPLHKVVNGRTGATCGVDGNRMTACFSGVRSDGKRIGFVLSPAGSWTF